MKFDVSSLNNQDRVTTEIVHDGPSLPILQISISYGSTHQVRAWTFLDNEGVAQLIKSLQMQLAEM